MDAWANEMELNLDTPEDDSGIDDQKEYEYNTFDLPFGMAQLRRYAKYYLAARDSINKPSINAFIERYMYLSFI